MFKISKSCEYAILFLVNLTKEASNQQVKLKIITKQTGLPYKFLSRIVLKLKKAKIIASKKGIKGGYFLTKKPQNISLISIIQAVEGKRGLASCVYGRCSLAANCFHQRIWLRLQNTLDKELAKIKLSDLVYQEK